MFRAKLVAVVIKDKGMKAFGSDVSALDRPEVLERLFHPRKGSGHTAPDGALDHLIRVEEGVQLGARFYLSAPLEPHILFFHGNGEVASDYDSIGPIYNRHGMNFLVVDYRGYGKSGGKPTASSLLSDAHQVFTEVRHWLESQNRLGLFIIMGRSLGSVSALEIGHCYQNEIAGLIIESGFARTVPLLNRLGVETGILGISEANGFANFGKIREIGKPTLIIHGQNDEIIPLEDADILLSNSGTHRKQLMLASGCGHNDILLRCREAYFDTIKNFVEMVKRLSKSASMRGGFDRRYPRRR